MKKWLPMFVAFSLSIVSCRTLGSPMEFNRAADEAAIKLAERAWTDRALEGKADAFAAYMAPEYMALRSNGLFRDKETWVNQIRTAQTTYAKVDLTDMKVRFPTPDVAVVTANYYQEAQGASTTGGGSYINTWVRINGRWQVVSSGFVRPAGK
jgi:ketosteroid isomerase-like protein